MSASRRLLVLLPDPPLPFGNAASRWFYVLLRGLVDRGHRVSCFATSRRPEDQQEARSLFPEDQYDLRLFAESRPWASLGAKVDSFLRPYSYTYSPEMRRALDEELSREFDLLHIEQVWGAYFGRNVAARSLVHLHYLYRIDHDATTSGNLKSRLLRRRTRQVERDLLQGYPWISTLTPRLTTEVQQIVKKTTEVRTIPLAMDLSLYPFNASPPPERPPVLTLIGSFNWAPSYSAGERLLKQLWPRIKAQVPECRLQLVGRKAEEAFRDFQRGADVTLIQDVPDTIPYFLEADTLLYAPSRGSGIKVKVLEAMALGLPVVTTEEGVEGLSATDCVHAGISDHNDGLVERTIELLRDPQRRQRQRLAARQLVEQTCSPDPVLDALEAYYERIIAAQQPVSART